MKPRLLYYVFSILSLISCISLQAAVNKKDSLALVDLYNSTNGNSWLKHDNWLSTKPLRTWDFVTVENGRVVQLDLTLNNLDGTIPASFGNLTKLQTVSLAYNNHLHGALPSSIGNLTSLTALYIYEDSLSGKIPSAIGNLVNLQRFFANSNHFSGSLPASIGKLKSLTVLDLSVNNLSGKIPSSIGDLANIQTLNITTTYISGNLPATIGKLSNLVNLLLSYNALTGSIPSSIGKLVHLVDLELNNNQFTGSIPASVGNLVSLQSLRLAANLLTGTVPASLGNLTNCQLFDLESNRLTGHIPDSLLLKASSYSSVYLNNNLLSDTDNVYPTASLQSSRLFIHNNNLNFNGLEWVATQDYQLTKDAYRISYAPQAKLAIHSSGAALSVYAGGTLSKNTYTWFRANTNDSTVIKGDSVFHPAQSGRYYAHITNSIAYRIVLVTDTVTYAESALAANKSGINMSAVTKSAINTANTFTVYPNPVINKVSVRVNQPSVIVVTNSSGRVVATKTVADTGYFDLTNMPGGIYYIQNKTTGKTLKLLVTH